MSAFCLLIQFAAHYCLRCRSDGDDDLGRRVLSIMKSVKFDIEEMRKQEASLPAEDGWLFSLMLLIGVSYTWLVTFTRTMVLIACPNLVPYSHQDFSRNTNLQ